MRRTSGENTNEVSLGKKKKTRDGLDDKHKKKKKKNKIKTTHFLYHAKALGQKGSFTKLVINT